MGTSVDTFFSVGTNVGIFVATNVATHDKLVYITLTTCRGTSEPKTAKVTRISAKMRQKNPFSLATAAGNRKTAKKRGTPGTQWGGGVAAPRPS